MASPWVYEEALHRYRSTSTGRFIGAKEMLGLRDKFIEAQKLAADELAQKLIDGKLTPAEWLTEFRGQIKTSYIDQYILGRGGRNAMTPSDWGKLGNQIKAQYKYAQGFAQSVEKGEISEAMLKARGHLYHSASAEAFETAKAASWNIKLPNFPGDGSTLCKTNCACSWSIVEEDGKTVAYWTLGAAEHCDDCLQRSQEWAPYHG